MRVGFGFDVHRFAENRKLILGGIQIPYEKGLEGHSDADCLIHAIIDALLGAAALGDIGSHFPDSSEEFKGIDSTLLLRKTRELLLSQQYIIGNIDATIVAQEPKMKPYIDKMRQRLADIMSILPGQISIKATTTERLGFEGRKEGISCYAVALIREAND
ncbi:MAG: 2-C-methyl-D-erythritol 2,4-cyclodiphosphate synthase [Calditrichia bacterium]